MNPRPGVTEVAEWLAEAGEFKLTAWPAEVGSGYPVASYYGETFWLPLMGPTTLWIIRRLVARQPGAVIHLIDLAGEMGLGQQVARHSPVVRSTARLAMFDLARMDGAGLAVRPNLPHLTIRQEASLPLHLQRSHVLLPRPASRARAAAGG